MAATVVREARRRAGISQRELARRAGTSQPAVARIEAGRQSPGHTTLVRLVEACGLELRYELAGPPEPLPAHAVEGEVLVVEAGGTRFGLALPAVKSVEHWSAPRVLPRAPVGVLGLVALAGNLVTVLDPLMRMGAGAVEEPGALIALTTAEGAYALAVNSVIGLEIAPPGAVQPPPPVLGSPPGVVGVGLLGDQVVAVLDPARLIQTNPRLEG